MTLDAGAQHVLNLIKEAKRPAFNTLTPAEAREVSAASRRVMQPDPPEVALVEDLKCPGPAGKIRLRRYRGIGTDPDAALPCLVYMHGGGWVIGDLDSHDQVCRRLANLTGASVIAIDYRLAPEHRYPAAVEDSAAAYRYICSKAKRLGIDRTRIVVGGDSAGGNLAAVLALMALHGELPMPDYQVLFYPVTDMAGNPPSYDRFTEGLVLTRDVMKWFIAHYLGPKEKGIDWRASPLRAPSLAGLPPAFLMTAGVDPLVDEGIAYAKRLDEEGVNVTHLHVADQIHACLTMGRVIPKSDLVLQHAAASLRAHWGS